MIIKQYSLQLLLLQNKTKIQKAQRGDIFIAQCVSTGQEIKKDPNWRDFLEKIMTICQSKLFRY